MNKNIILTVFSVAIFSCTQTQVISNNNTDINKTNNVNAPSPLICPDLKVSENQWQLLIEPNNPCIGQSSTVKGINFKNYSITQECKQIVFVDKNAPVTLWLEIPEINLNSGTGKGRPPNPDSMYKLGSTILDEQGSFTIDFQLNDTIGPSKNGLYAKLEKNKNCNFVVEISGSNRFYPFKTCQ